MAPMSATIRLYRYRPRVRTIASDAPCPVRVTKYGRSVPTPRHVGGRGVGRSPAGLSDPSRLLAIAHADHPRDRGGETEGLHVPAHAVHVPPAEDRGGHGRATHVPRDESHATASRIRGPPLGLRLQARLRGPPTR